MFIKLDDFIGEEGGKKFLKKNVRSLRKDVDGTRAMHNVDYPPSGPRVQERTCILHSHIYQT